MKADLASDIARKSWLCHSSLTRCCVLSGTRSMLARGLRERAGLLPASRETHQQHHSHRRGCADKTPDQLRCMALKQLGWAIPMGNLYCFPLGTPGAAFVWRPKPLLRDQK